MKNAYAGASAMLALAAGLAAGEFQPGHAGDRFNLPKGAFPAADQRQAADKEERYFG